MAHEESGAQCTETEVKEGKRRAVAGFTLGGEQTTLSATSLCRWVIRRETGGRHDSTESIPVGVTEKQFVVYLWTLRQNVSRRAVLPTLGVNRSAPERRMGAINDVANLWQRLGGRPAPGGLRRRIRVNAPWARAKRREKCAAGSRAGVNQYPSHRTDLLG